VKPSHFCAVSRGPSKSARSERRPSALGSTGCRLQLPAACRRIHGAVENQSRQAAETYRLAACAPQKIARTLQFPGSARVSRVGDDVSSSQTFLKIVSARRRNQHARRVRYPELLLNTCEEMVGRDSVEPGKIDGYAERRPTVQCAETMGLVSQRHVHPANRPTSRLQARNVLLSQLTRLPSSNSTDQKFHGPLSVVLAKSKWL